MEPDWVQRLESFGPDTQRPEHSLGLAWPFFSWQVFGVPRALSKTERWTWPPKITRRSFPLTQKPLGNFVLLGLCLEKHRVFKNISWTGRGAKSARPIVRGAHPTPPTSAAGLGALQASRSLLKSTSQRVSPQRDTPQNKRMRQSPSLFREKCLQLAPFLHGFVIHACRGVCHQPNCTTKRWRPRGNLLARSAANSSDSSPS